VEATHIQKRQFETEFTEPRSKNSGLSMSLTLRSLVSKSIPLLLGRIMCFQLRTKTTILECLKPPLPMKLEMKACNNQRGPSSSKLGTCEGHNSFKLTHWLCFKIRIFEYVWLPVQEAQPKFPTSWKLGMKQTLNHALYKESWPMIKEFYNRGTYPHEDPISNL
jgi:hypothetical protein